MFMRSENLLLRPIWPEDRGRVRALRVPRDHPVRAGDLFASFLVTHPSSGLGAPVGLAGWDRNLSRKWWLDDGLDADAEIDAALAEMIVAADGRAPAGHLHPEFA